MGIEMFYAYKLKPKEYSCSVKAHDGMVYGITDAASKGAAVKQLREAYGVAPKAIEIELDCISPCSLNIHELMAVYQAAELGKTVFSKMYDGSIYAIHSRTGDASPLGFNLTM